jgi:hypothetical protein
MGPDELWGVRVDRLRRLEAEYIEYEYTRNL